MYKFRTQDQSDEDFGLVPPVLDCSGDPLITRQEERDLADINRVFQKYRATGQLPTGREGFSGDVDYDIDRLTAINAVREFQEGYERLSPELRKRYPTVRSLVDAVNEGTFDMSPVDPKRRAEDAPRDRRSSDKAAAEAARFDRAVEAAAAKRSAAGS